MFNLLPPNISLKLFADDVKLYSTVTPIVMQLTYNVVFMLSVLKLSPSKCSVMHLSPRRANHVFTFPSHARTVVREWCKGDVASQWENGKFDPLPRRNPLTDRHKKLHTWLRHGYLPTCKIYSRSFQGFLFPVCAKLRIKDVYSASFFRVLPTAYSPGPWTDFHA